MFICIVGREDMQYFGGKAKIAKELSVVLNSYLVGNDKPFIDAFCGSCNIISKVDSNRIRIANDKHKELIAMWQYVQEEGCEGLPLHITKEMYTWVKTNPLVPEWLKGFVGFGCSFAGKWWGGYATSDNKERNYAVNAINTIHKKMLGLNNVSFVCGDYFDVAIPSVPSIIYCDIPYKNTTGYSSGAFNHEQFYEWAYSMKSLGHIVLISEYESGVPLNMKDNIVWRKESKKDIRDKDGKQQRTIEVLIKL